MQRSACFTCPTYIEDQTTRIMKLLTTLLILFLSIGVNAQERSEGKLSFESYCEKEAIYYAKLSPQKADDLEISGELVSLEHKKGASFKDYGIQLLEDRTQYFQLIDSDKVLVVKSLYVLRLNFDNL